MECFMAGSLNVKLKVETCCRLKFDLWTIVGRGLCANNYALIYVQSSLVESNLVWNYLVVHTAVAG